ncbi:FITM1 protein, partial [Polyodon spathula]|nr:fat storage-inducing transmembrane protein 1-like [Polyodon spathula]MBN3271143.1 FITM1 protein [Polyodon spathula]
MVLERPVVLLSELVARCLGNAHFRRHFHLWVALLILLGPGLTFHVSHSTVFANRRNFLYLYFLRSGWGWTCLLTGGFVLLVSYSSTRSPASCLRHLTRLLVASLLWKGALWSFAQVENATGSCFQPIRSEIPEATAAAHKHASYSQGGGASASSSPLLLLRETENKASCLAEGFQWRGYDISEDTFLLTFAALLVAEETAVFRPYLSRGHPAGVPLRLVFLLCSALLLLWNFLLLCVLVYFQRYTHKLLGGALATLCWRLLYHGWYKSGPCWYSPGRPGVGLFDTLDHRDN